MMKQNSITLDGLRIVYEEMGQGPLVVLLHGFPDTARTWRRVMPRLAEAGYHVVAPYLRGFAPSDLAGEGLSLASGAADLTALVAALGADGTALLAGHNVGAEIVVEAAGTMDTPPRVATLGTPVPGWPIDLAGPDQMKRSWYAFLAARPDAPSLFAWDECALLDQLWADWSPRWPAGPEGDLDGFREALLGAAMDGVFEYFRLRSFIPGAPPKMPMLHLHGAEDGCIGADVARVAGEEFATGSRVEILAGIGHFVQLEAGDQVAEHLITWARG